MDRAKYDAFVRTFFDCDPKAVTGIFEEFLAAMTAEEGLPPGHYLSQNYDTARANPEIHVLPGNLKDARGRRLPVLLGHRRLVQPAASGERPRAGQLRQPGRGHRLPAEEPQPVYRHV